MIAFMATNKKTERELFEILSKGANVVTAVQVRAWCEVWNAPDSTEAGMISIPFLIITPFLYSGAFLCEVVLEANKEEVTTAIEHADFPRPMTKQTLAGYVPILYIMCPTLDHIFNKWVCKGTTAVRRTFVLALHSPY